MTTNTTKGREALSIFYIKHFDKRYSINQKDFFIWLGNQLLNYTSGPAYSGFSFELDSHFKELKRNPLGSDLNMLKFSNMDAYNLFKQIGRSINKEKDILYKKVCNSFN